MSRQIKSRLNLIFPPKTFGLSFWFFISYRWRHRWLFVVAGGDGWPALPAWVLLGSEELMM